MPISAMRRQAEILSRCAEASYWMATQSREDGRALRIREAASLLEEVASALRAVDRPVPLALPPRRRLHAV